MSLRAEGTPLANLTLGATGRYVAASYLDNTNAEDLEAPRFFQLDASIGFDLSHFVSAGRPRLKVQVNNLFDNHRIFPRGYSYLYATQSAGGARRFRASRTTTPARRGAHTCRSISGSE